MSTFTDSTKATDYSKSMQSLIGPPGPPGPSGPPGPGAENAVLYVEQSLTQEQQEQAKQNIGAVDLLVYSEQELTPEQQKQVKENIGVSEQETIEAVLYTPQSLTPAQQTQAKQNIGVTEQVAIPAVLYTSQELTATQQEQARENISVPLPIEDAVKFTAQSISDSQKQQARNNIGVESASQIAEGLIQIASAQDIDAGTDMTKAVTPSQLKAAAVSFQHIKILNKEPVIIDDINNLQQICTSYVQVNYSREPQELDALFVTIDSDVVEYVYTNSVWLYTGFDQVDLTQYIKKDDVVDALTSSEPREALSANQGRVLNEALIAQREELLQLIERNYISTYNVDSQEKFDTWINNTPETITDNDYSHVYIKTLPNNAEYILTKTINLSTIGTLTVSGSKNVPAIIRHVGNDTTTIMRSSSLVTSANTIEHLKFIRQLSNSLFATSSSKVTLYGVRTSSYVTGVDVSFELDANFVPVDGQVIHFVPFKSVTKMESCQGIGYYDKETLTEAETPAAYEDCDTLYRCYVHMTGYNKSRRYIPVIGVNDKAVFAILEPGLAGFKHCKNLVECSGRGNGGVGNSATIAEGGSARAGSSGSPGFALFHACTNIERGKILEPIVPIKTKFVSQGGNGNVGADGNSFLPTPSLGGHGGSACVVAYNCSSVKNCTGSAFEVNTDSAIYNYFIGGNGAKGGNGYNSALGRQGGIGGSIYGGIHNSELVQNNNIEIVGLPTIPALPSHGSTGTSGTNGVKTAQLHTIVSSNSGNTVVSEYKHYFYLNTYDSTSSINFYTSSVPSISTSASSYVLENRINLFDII